MAVADRIFAAVFPPPSDFEVPTPPATPILGSSSFGVASTPYTPTQPVFETGAAEQIKWDGAWHTATTFLTLPDEPIIIDDGEEVLRLKFITPYSYYAEIQKAVEYVLSEDSRGRQLRQGENCDDLLRWYFEVAVLDHYCGHMLPMLTRDLRLDSSLDSLLKVAHKLNIAQQIYLYPLEHHVLQVLPAGGQKELARFRRDLQGLFGHTLPQRLIEERLADLFRELASAIVINDQIPPDSSFSSYAATRQETIEQMGDLREVGLVGFQAQRILADVMCDTLALHIKSNYSRKWEPNSNNEQTLHGYVQSVFAGFIKEVLASTEDENSQERDEAGKITQADVERWQEMGINRLGVLRTNELFDVIVEWDGGSQGAIEDLRLFIKNPASRTYLTSTFSSVISHRLLVPGASTTEILQVYIAIIRAFTELDPKGVLLDRVARPIRHYLRERDDTALIVVGGLLADPDDEPGGETLVELALEMNKQSGLKQDETADDFDFDDMEWMPDPVDAGPEYRKSKNSDVIGSLTSLFESKDVFVKEFQNVLGERLLKKDFEFDREIRVLELLKLRFGEAALQACEVMLRDILDSRRIDAFIQKEQQQQLHLPPPQQPSQPPTLHARILSHLFWPALHTDTFHIPPEITTLQTHYATSFTSLKQSRKLTWLHALGQVTVTLDLQDRTVTEEVQTWQAAVIHAFQPPPHSPPFHPVTKTLPELTDALQMPEPLLLNALTFWTAKLVLKCLPHPQTPPTYTVLETLTAEASSAAAAAATQNDTAILAAQAATATATAATSAVLTEHEVTEEKMELYAQYVIGMLTNGGPMPLQQIVMMLKMTVPGGFPFGNEELKAFLEGEVRGGRLGFEGGGYRILRGG